MLTSSKQIKITPFGSLGWIPSSKRHTCCYVIEFSNVLVILDAGTGISRFSEPLNRAILDNYENILIVLSHYHLDHIVGLTYLPQFLKDKKVIIVGPGMQTYNETIEDILNNLITQPYFALPLKNYPMDLKMLDLNIGTNYFYDIILDTIPQKHSDPSIGVKVNNIISYITDVSPEDSLIDFIKGSKVLLHETWFDDEDYRQLSNRGKYSSDIEIAIKSHANINWVIKTAKLSGVDHVMLIHLNPSYSEERFEAMRDYSQQRFKNTILAHDNQSITFNL